MRPISLSGFEGKFAADRDPWGTFTKRDEALKRQAILTALGPGPWGRVLELGAGNGSNSVALAQRALRLDATEATDTGTALIGKALRGHSRARAIRLAVPGQLPRACYDVVVVAELLYYLTPPAMARTARDAARALRPGGMLILAHHRIDFPDFTQHAAFVHERFLHETGARWQVRAVRATRQWSVLSCRRAGSPRSARAGKSGAGV